MPVPSNFTDPAGWAEYKQLLREFIERRRQENQHGQHRQPDPAPSGGAAEASGARDNRTRGGAARSHAAIVAAITAVGAGKGYYTGPMIGPAARIGIAYRAMPAPPIPDAGIRVGEIIGWRAWRVVEADSHVWLASICSAYGWHPRNPATGKLDELMVGVHAWRDPGSMMRYVYDLSIEATSYVTGEVALWGTVIEHDHGYRAEYARPVGFDRIYPRHDPDLLARLRTTYLEERA